MGQSPDFSDGLNAIMTLRDASRSGSPRSLPYRVFRDPDADLVEETHRIASLANVWLVSQDRPRADPLATRRVERRLHDAIKASPLFGKVLSFAGLNLWVDDRTSDGLVMCQECVNL